MAFRVQSLATVATAGFEFEDRGSGVTNIFTPENERIELFDDTSVNLDFTRDDGAADAVAQRHNEPLDGSIRAHHLHLYLVDDAVEEAQAWYAATFGGTPGIRWQYDAVDLPGINFNFSYNPDAGGAPTKGRMLDHIGLEVENLERFCRELEGRGVTFDVTLPPQRVRHRLRLPHRSVGRDHRAYGGAAGPVAHQPRLRGCASRDAFREDAKGCEECNRYTCAPCAPWSVPAHPIRLASCTCLAAAW